MRICANEWTIGPGADCRRFDFTFFFEALFLVGVPALLYTFYAFCTLPAFRKRSSILQEQSRWTTAMQILLLVKSAAGLLLVAASILSAIAWSASFNTWSMKIGQSFQIIAAILVLLASITFHFRFYRSDMALSLYLVATIFCDAALIRTHYLAGLATSKIAIATYLSLSARLILLAAENTDKSSIIERDSTGRPVALEATAPSLNQLFFVWLDPLLYRGFRQPLRMDMLGSLDPALETETLYKQTEKNWTACLDDKRKRPLIRAILRTYRWQIFSPLLPNLLAASAQITVPLLIQSLLQFLASYENGRPEPAEFGYGLGAAYALVFIIQSISYAQYNLGVNRNQTMIRGLLVELIYRKTFKCHLEVVGEIGAGMGTSLMSVDAERVVGTVLAVNEAFSAIVTITIGFVILHHAIGISFLATLIAAVITLVACPLVAKDLGGIQGEWAGATDARIRLMSSILRGIKQIQMSAYEDTLESKVGKLRQKEEQSQQRFFKELLSVVVLSNYLGNIMNITTLVTFFLLNRSNGRFNTTNVFTVIATVEIVSTPMNNFSQNIASMLSAWASFQRIEKFLLQREFSVAVGNDEAGALDDDLTSKEIPLDEIISPALPLFDDSNARPDVQSDSIFSLQNVTLVYGNSPVLTNISAEIKQGSFVMLLGAVGSGKTTFLKTLLGEVDKASGEWTLPQQAISLTTQDGWLQEGQSIRDNICFLADFDRPWYNQVIRATALDVDFQLMDLGDRKLASGLSGGQVQFVSFFSFLLNRQTWTGASVWLVRYIQGQISIFWMIASLLWAHVFMALFGANGLLVGKTVVLATNAVHRLAYADKLIVLADSTIPEQGALDDLLQNGTYAKDLVNRFGASQKKSDKKSLAELESQAENNAAGISVAPSQEQDLIAMEMAGKYWNGNPIFAFLRAGGFWLSTLALATATATFSMSGLTPLYTSVWTGTNAQSAAYLGGYIGMQVVYLFSFLLAFYVQMLLWNRRASGSLHRKLARSVLAAPLSFFEETPMGTILNRVDCNSVDLQFTNHFGNAFAAAVTVAVAAVLIAVATYYTIPIIFIAAVAFILTQRFYIRSSRQLRQLALASKSPMYTHFGQAINPNGLLTIRAFKGSNQLTTHNTELATASQTPYYLQHAVKRWLSLVLNLISTVINVALVFLAVSQRNSARVALFALALQQGVSLTLNLEQVFSSYSELEIEATSVTRVMQFGSLPPEEAQAAIDYDEKSKKAKEHDNLASGSISFNNATLRYSADASPALNEMSLKIRDGERVGFVGRTGSGKSTTLAALLRLRDIDDGGAIFVDGKPITSKTRHQLRSQIAIIPQDPLLLDLSLRENLDLYGEKSDEEIWSALESCGAKDFVAALEAKLDSGVSADGSAFSRGQRQLVRRFSGQILHNLHVQLALARVVLSPRKIICLDEASVDVDTDAKIQQTIRKSFEGRTVLCVAHRLATVIDYDTIVVLDAGRVIETAPPHELLQNSEGAFYKLAQEQGLFGIKSGLEVV